ncbi:MAG: GGDEF domain-containing protein [bacterium]
MKKDYSLILVDSGAAVKKLPINKGRFIIGRADDADLVISNKDVSRRHAAVICDGSNFSIEDLDSTNGTFVNGKRIIKESLDVGDEISVGDYKIFLDDGSGNFSYAEATQIGRKGAETVILEKRFSTLRQKLQDDGLKEEFRTIEDVVKKSRKKLSTMANEDKLTGLYSRHYFDRRSRAEFSQAEKTNRELSILFIDIDHFKKVNDKYGHEKGDVALRVIARLIQASCRKSDFVARYGGEEIVVILPNTISRDALQVGSDINAVIARQSNKLLGFQITVSVGVATYPNDGTTLKQVLINADKALYRAKDTGRNRVWKFDEARD